MSDTKIFSLGDNSGLGGGGMAGLIASLCQNRGLDPNMVAAMMNNNRGNGGWGDMGAWWIVILLIFGWGGFGNSFGGGFGGRGSAQGLADLGNLVNNDAGRELLMQAIQGNGQAISQLASTLHCDVNALNGAINNLSTQLGQLGLGQRDIIAAMQSGNTAIMSKLCDCCCENRLAISQQTNTLQGAINTLSTGVERGFAATNYATAQQTCEIKNAIAAQTQVINDKFCALEMREMQRENQNLRDQVQAFQLSASQQQQTANLVAQLRPCPSPAYVVPNPFGCGCNNYGYPFNGNNCGSCNNNGCGCR
ncbi:MULTISPECIES: hypothetical protein [Bacteroidales]|uniref:hypothetical protein n=1 Tax=Bacteroidales TaxID=171549 RepID=UPI002595D936|nr:MULTISPECIES: hypothetical protein [Bacteroidales]